MHTSCGSSGGSEEACGSLREGQQVSYEPRPERDDRLSAEVLAAADLAFQTAGQIVRFPAIDGQFVPAGEVIARLDLESFELSREQARLERALVHRRAERLKELEGSAASQVSVEDAATEAGLADIALRNAGYALEHATLHAPFDALVARRYAARFATVNAGTPVIRFVLFAGDEGPGAVVAPSAA